MPDTDIQINILKVRAALEEYAHKQPFNETMIIMSALSSVIDEAKIAADEFLHADLKKWNEDPPQMESFRFHRDFQGSIDINFVRERDKRKHVVDWKRVQRFYPEKVQKYLRSDQPWMYAELVKRANPEYNVTFEYRFYVADYKECLSFVYEETDALNHVDREAEVKLLRETIERYNEAGVWPRSYGHCVKFGPKYQCAHFDRCWTDNEAPPKIDQLLTTQSLMETFRDCPRLYAYSLADAEALGKDFHEVGGSNEASIYGTMFHIAMAEIYRQAFLRDR